VARRAVRYVKSRDLVTLTFDPWGSKFHAWSEIFRPNLNFIENEMNEKCNDLKCVQKPT